MFQYLNPKSLEQYPELKAFLEASDPAQYQALASTLQRKYLLEFLKPVQEGSKARHAITSRRHVASIVAYLGGLEKLKVLLGDQLRMPDSPMSDVYLSAALVGSEENARAILLHLKGCRSEPEFRRMLVEQVALALLSCIAEEEKARVIGLLNVIYTPEEKQAFLSEMLSVTSLDEPAIRQVEARAHQTLNMFVTSPSQELRAPSHSMAALTYGSLP